MTPTRRGEPISSWQAGDRVTGFALLSRKERRQDRNGQDYLDLLLTDATGSMAAKAWADSAALTGEYEAHDFVAFKGSVKSYRERLQISIQDCRRATEDDRARGFDESLLVPSTREDIGELWQRLQAIYPSGIRRPELQRLATEALATFGETLREHPAAKVIHHAYRGGLLEHTVSMAELSQALCSHYRELDSDLVLLGVLFHDLGKTIEIGAMPRNDYTEPGRLVGHVVIGRDLLRGLCGGIPDFPEDLQLHLEHLVLSHQGRKEYGSPVEPMTAEALALHFVDHLDSNLAQLRQARESGGGFQFLRGFGRLIYLGAEDAPDEESESGPTAAADRPQKLLDL